MKVRTIIKLGTPEAVAKARREREAHCKWLRAQSPQAKAKKAAYNKAYRAEKKEEERERKRKWREDNRERFRAYYRNYDALTPGRREYKAAWLRKNRANPTRPAA